MNTKLRNYEHMRIFTQNLIDIIDEDVRFEMIDQLAQMVLYKPEGWSEVRIKTCFDKKELAKRIILAIADE